MKMIGELVNRLGLGQLCEEPEAVSGGLLHKMYRVMTTGGIYAVKVLNAEIMKRPTALQNMINSEKVAIALAGSVPVVAALELQGEQVQELDGTYYMIYPWVEGRSIFPGEITKEHCEIIGDLLGRIHGANVTVTGLEPEEEEAAVYPWEECLRDAQEQMKLSELQEAETVDVQELMVRDLAAEPDELVEMERGLQVEQGMQAAMARSVKAAENVQSARMQNIKKPSWIAQYEAALKDICAWNRTVCEAQRVLRATMVVSHRDLDPKNVMWQEGNAYLIDWEAAGYVNPYQELLEVVNYWADDGQGGLVQEYAEAIVAAYKKYHDLTQVSWSEVFAGSYAGMLGWLEYNVKRALGIEVTDEQEMQMGAEQVEGTIRALYAYQKKQEVLFQLLEN